MAEQFEKRSGQLKALPIVAGLLCAAMLGTGTSLLQTPHALSLVNLFAFICLVFLSPFPIYFTGILCGNKAALYTFLWSLFPFIASMLASDQLGVPSLPFLIAFLLPSVWFTYLYRYRDPDTGIWYPTGNILSWMALSFAFLLTFFYLFYFDFDEFRLLVHESILDSGGILPQDSANDGSNPKIMDIASLEEIAQAMISAFSSFWLFANLLSAYGAMRLTGYLGCSPRSVTDFGMLEIPNWITTLTAAAWILCWSVPEFPSRFVFFPIAVILTHIHVLTGLAILHTVTRGFPARKIILGGVYLSLLFTHFSYFLLAILAVVDSILNLRTHKDTLRKLFVRGEHYD